ncbi:MAG: hypothetical protein M3Z15_07365, partial [Pseudomonadota bacterium]|nr:hypothetical protein [Pseudomonadota bacterium]
MSSVEASSHTPMMQQYLLEGRNDANDKSYAISYAKSGSHVGPKRGADGTRKKTSEAAAAKRPVNA